MILLCGLAILSQGHHEPTRFRVEETDGWSWFERPDGATFFSSGVCCVDQGATPKTYKADNPGYASYRHYVNEEEWAKDTARRLHDWGFNTIGAWSDDRALRKGAIPETYFTPILHMGSSAGAPWKDLWDPKVVATMDSVAREGIAAHKGDASVIGYFSDNELGWWNAAMFEWGLKAGPYSRAKLVDLLRTRYRNDWKLFSRDFDPEGASSFEGLRKRGRLFLRPGGNAMASVQAWMSVVSNRYYALCRGIVKKYDPFALYLGDRYISNYYPEVAKSAGKYCDVVSTNLNADWNDGSFARFFLPNLHRLTGRPLMITEYYAAARENRSGNKNDSSGFPVVQTQAQRAQVFRRSSQTFLSTPYIVGAHWFQYYDEPKNGREDGENYNMGLVDTENRPYETLVSTSRALFASPKRYRQPEAAPTAEGARLRASQVADLARWPREKAFVPPIGNAERGDLYVGQDARWLYLAIYWNEDRFGESYYRAGHVPVADRAKLTVRFADRGSPVVARLGDEGTPKVSGAHVVAFKWGVRNTAILRVEKPQKTGKIAIEFETRGRAYHMRWAVPFKPLP